MLLNCFQNYQRAEKDAAAYLRKQQDYQLLDADDDEETEPVPVESASRKESKRKHLRKKREVSDVDEDDEVRVKSKTSRNVGCRSNVLSVCNA